MKVVLIVPRDTIGTDHRKPLGLVPHLGLLSVATVARARGHEVAVVDSCVTGEDPVATARRALALSPGAVGITATTAVYREARLIAGELKTGSSVPIVLGGMHASALPEACLAAGVFDYVIAGEGEYSFAELLSHFAGNRDRAIPGLGYCDSAGTPVLHPPELIEDSDALPIPDWSLLDITAYTPAASNYRRLPAICAILSRGCPYDCMFCGHKTIFKRRVRLRSPQRVEEEVRQLHRLGIRDINFWDSTFTVKRDWVLAVCEILKRYDMLWNCITRIDAVDEELLRIMAVHGCYCIGYGVETGSPKTLERLGKCQDFTTVKRVVEQTQAVGIEAKIYYSFGYPWETEEDIRDTLAFSKALQADISTFTIIEPYPGCELYDQYGAVVGDDDFTGMNHFSARYAISEHLTPEQLVQLLDEAYRNIYRDPAYLWRQLLKIRSLTGLRKNLGAFLTLFNPLRR